MAEEKRISVLLDYVYTHGQAGGYHTNFAGINLGRVERIKTGQGTLLFCRASIYVVEPYRYTLVIGWKRGKVRVSGRTRIVRVLPVRHRPDQVGVEWMLEKAGLEGPYRYFPGPIER